jgi:benzoylformate decarboxylase
MTNLDRTAAHDFIDVLLAWGITDVFTCPGSTEAPFLDASLDRPQLKVWLTTHEVTAVAMADGFARSTGTPAVAYLHTIVGLSNGLGAMYAAQLGRSPILVATGLKAAAIQSRRGFTAPPHIRDLPRQFAKWEWQSLSAEHVAADTTRALQSATTSPPGPVWIGLAEDVMAGHGVGVASSSPSPKRRAVPAYSPDPAQVGDAAAMLAAAKRPLIVAGADIAREGAADLLVEISERLDAPVAHEDRRSFERSVFPTGHPNFVGLYSASLLQSSQFDVIAFLGARCFHEFEATSAPLWPRDARIIHTNSDPDEIGKTYGSDVSVVGDHRRILVQLLDQLPAPHQPGRQTPPGTTQGQYRDEPASQVGLDVAAVAGVLATTCTWDSVVLDATTSNAALIDALPQERPNQLLATSSGALGWGMGAAAGIAAAGRTKRVLCAVGDGSFQFGIQALWVAARYALPVTFVVINNQSYAAVAAALNRYGRRAVEVGEYPGKDIAGPRIAAVAEGFGVPATCVTTLDELVQHLQKADATPGPALIEVMTDPDDLGPGSAPRTRPN